MYKNVSNSCAPFEPFRDIVGNGEHSPLELVTQTALAPERRLRGYGVSRQGQLDTGLPDWKFLKAFVPHTRPLESGILNLEL
jgi:hypothetical protein